MWQVWLVSFDSNNVVRYLDKSYETALSLLDPSSRERLNRFYRKEDTFRGLVGRLLSRLVLKEQGVSQGNASFSVTEAGKPYVAIEGDYKPLGFNITHDNGLIGMVYSSGEDLYPDPPAYRLGVDVMRLQAPHRQSLNEFVEIFTEQLTNLELRSLLLTPPLEDSEVIRRFFLMWTLKEAYTKALGLGLGFDFQRVEYDVIRDTVRIDGGVPNGWEFVRFEVDVTEDGKQNQYVGVACRYVGEEVSRGKDSECIVAKREAGEWLQVFEADEFVPRAVRDLQSQT